jgi:hypothetical protein
MAKNSIKLGAIKLGTGYSFTYLGEFLDEMEDELNEQVF